MRAPDSREPEFPECLAASYACGPESGARASAAACGGGNATGAAPATAVSWCMSTDWRAMRSLPRVRATLPARGAGGWSPSSFRPPRLETVPALATGDGVAANPPIASHDPGGPYSRGPARPALGGVRVRTRRPLVHPCVRSLVLTSALAGVLFAGPIAACNGDADCASGSSCLKPDATAAGKCSASATTGADNAGKNYGPGGGGSAPAQANTVGKTVQAVAGPHQRMQARWVRTAALVVAGPRRNPNSARKASAHASRTTIATLARCARSIAPRRRPAASRIAEAKRNPARLAFPGSCKGPRHPRGARHGHALRPVAGNHSPGDQRPPATRMQREPVFDPDEASDPRDRAPCHEDERRDPSRASSTRATCCSKWAGTWNATAASNARRAASGSPRNR